MMQPMRGEGQHAQAERQRQQAPAVIVPVLLYSKDAHRMSERSATCRCPVSNVGAALYYLLRFVSM